MTWQYSHQILTPSLKSWALSTEIPSYQRHNSIEPPPSFIKRQLVSRRSFPRTSFASNFVRVNGITLLKVCDEIGGKLDMFFFSPEHPPLTEATQRALAWAINEKYRSGENGEITTAHILVGLWQQQESLGHASSIGV